MSNDPTRETSANSSPLPATADPSQNNSPDHVIWEGTFSARGMVRWFFVSILLTVLLPVIAFLTGSGSKIWLGVVGTLICVWLLCFVVLKIRQWSHHYRLGETTLEVESGILNRKISPISLLFVTDVEMKQTILERIFNVGVIEVTSKDPTDPFRRLEGIRDPRKVYEHIRNQWNLMVRRRGIMTSAASTSGGEMIDGGMGGNGLQ
ncbi:MAG: PH domain-containing protein [Planctomycetia bacterium]|nr:PH domain-containing protein [Planctomycetia bacterium]